MPIEAENLTSNKEICLTKSDTLTDFLNSEKKNLLTFLSLKLINAKRSELNPPPNLTALLKQKMKTNLKDNFSFKDTKNSEEELKHKNFFKKKHSFEEKIKN